MHVRRHVCRDMCGHVPDKRIKVCLARQSVPRQIPLQYVTLVAAPAPSADGLCFTCVDMCADMEGACGCIYLCTCIFRAMPTASTHAICVFSTRMHVQILMSVNIYVHMLVSHRAKEAAVRSWNVWLHKLLAGLALKLRSENCVLAILVFKKLLTDRRVERAIGFLGYRLGVPVLQDRWPMCVRSDAPGPSVMPVRTERSLQSTSSEL